MATMTARTKIDATPERVWEVLSDFGGISEAAPHLTGSVLTTEQATGVGAARHCDIAMMGRSTEEVVTRWEDGRGYSVDLKMNGVPMRSARADFDISVEDGDTVLVGVMSMEMPFGPLRRAMERMSSRRMSALWSGMLAGFKERAETGKEIGPGTALPLEAVRVT
jgi:ligand-binding SRPBCC domain-containing protein